MQEFHWRAGIGDPTFGGWITVVVYVIAAISVFRTLREVPERGESVFWQGVFFLLIALAINKQLDLQSALTEFGRILAYSEGWYGQRGTFQLWFIVAVAALCTLLTIIFLILIRRAPGATWVGLLGMAIIFTFVLIRAASFHHIDSFIGSRVLGLKWNWILEIGGLSVVLLGSEWRRRFA